MANDRYSFLVVEESLPEGTIADHRRARPKGKHPVPGQVQRPPMHRHVIRTSARSRPAA